MQAGSSEWLKIHNSASLDYEVVMTTLRALPVSEALKYADRMYDDLYFAYQLRQKAVQMMEG